MAEPGLVRMAPDFGANNGGGEVDTAAIDARLDAIRANVAYVQSIRPTASKTKAQILAALDEIYNDNLGPFDDLAREAKELLHAPKVEPPPIVEPPPVVVTPPAFPTGGFARTYSGHGQAWDFYPNGPNGPHHGWWAVAPGPGRVDLYQVATPLGLVVPAGADEGYRANAAALLEGWTCGALDVLPQQTMYVPVYWPDQPITVQGQRLVWIGQGHSRGATVKQGRVATGDRMWQFWDSGVHFEARGIPGRCAHGHMICGVSTTLSPNGDIPGGYAILALGMPLPDLTSGAYGPDNYLAGQVQAGQAPNYWQTHPLPPPTE